MRDLVSCYSEYAVQISEASSCTSYPNTSSSCIPIPLSQTSLIPSIQIAVTCLYKTILSTKKCHLITVTWCKNNLTQGLQINSGDDPATAFRLNTNNSRFFRSKRKGSKSFEIAGSKFEVFWDLSSANYNNGPEPITGYFVLVMIDSELGLILGDMGQEAAMKKLKIQNRVSKFSLITRREHFSGNTLYSTKAQFCENGIWHDIMIRCSGENDGVKCPVLTVFIDKKMVIRVKRLQWNFRGNQTIFVDGLLVDLMWDVHHWFYDLAAGGYGVFMFRTRSGMDSRLWLEEKLVKKEDDKVEFSFLIHAWCMAALDAEHYLQEIGTQEGKSD